MGAQLHAKALRRRAPRALLQKMTYKDKTSCGHLVDISRCELTAKLTDCHNSTADFFWRMSTSTKRALDRMLRPLSMSARNWCASRISSRASTTAAIWFAQNGHVQPSKVSSKQFYVVNLVADSLMRISRISSSAFTTLPSLSYKMGTLNSQKSALSDFIK